jgi:MFS family permease
MKTRSASKAGGVLVLLVFSVCINYIDRGALSVTAPLIATELSLSPQQLGLLFSAFFWSYSLFQIVAGWLVDRYPVKWVYAGAYLLWSLATAATGFIGTFAVLLMIRFALGIGESVAYPACSRIIVRNFPEHRRGVANALVDVGAKVGPALSTLAGGLLVNRFGWRALFIGLGFASLIWLLPWIRWSESGRDPTASSAGQGPGMLEIMSRREAWGACLGTFALGYVWYFLLTWLPTYLVKARGFSMSEMAVLGSIPFWVMAAATLAGGWASDRWIVRGGTPTRVRKTFLVGGLLLCAAAILPVAMVDRAALSVALVTAACLFLGLFTSNVWAVTQTLAGPMAAGKWTGVQNAIGNLGGVVSPLLTGWIVAGTGSFVLAFAAASLTLVGGALSYLFLVPEIRTLSWKSTAFAEHGAK